MEGTRVSTTKIPSDFALEEFRALNAEILARLGRQNTFLGFSVAATGIALPLVIRQQIDLTIPMFAGVFTFLLWVVLLILAEQDYQIALAGKYVKTCLYPVLEKDGLKPMPGWEAYMERRRRTMTYAVQTAIKYAFVGLPILGIDVLVLGSFVFGQQPATFAHTIYLIVALIRYGIAFLVLKATVDEFRDDHSDCGSASE